jgi:ABC-type lipoprotein release transport system permease subunit
MAYSGVDGTMDFQIAWRNIWRNPRRTTVILTAVIIGVWSMIFLGALMRGVVDGMIQNGINTLTGHVQIHQRDYADDPSVDYRIQDPAAIEAVLSDSLPAKSKWSMRIRVTAVANNARHNSGVTLVGIDPDEEARMSFIGTAITQGRYLKSGDRNAVLVGKALAEQFETKLGRKLILMAQDKDGRIASRAFRIEGIFQNEMEATEKSFIFITRRAAQDMLKLNQAVSEISIRLPDYSLAQNAAQLLRDRLAGQDLSIRSWRKALPLLNTYLKMYDSFILIWFVVVFVAMGFGILNTTLMAVFERIREFGLLKALGMRPGRIVRGILIEALFILVLGIVVGNLMGLTSCWLLSFNGIDLSALAKGVEYAGMSRIILPVVMLKDIAVANLVVLVLGVIVCLYPAVKAARFTPVEAMAHT